MVSNPGMEAPQHLEQKIHLHIEVVQPHVIEIAVKEGIVGDLMEGLRTWILDPVIKSEVISQEPVFLPAVCASNPVPA